MSACSFELLLERCVATPDYAKQYYSIPNGTPGPLLANLYCRRNRPDANIGHPSSLDRFAVHNPGLIRGQDPQAGANG